MEIKTSSITELLNSLKGSESLPPSLEPIKDTWRRIWEEDSFEEFLLIL